ncbi:MAG TPA: DUF4440 domain-containing protein [Gemmatimonadales bacterium]|nr:DUF4440 domain-containing protein [Gemmatimonadales bacterium]
MRGVLRWRDSRVRRARARWFGSPALVLMLAGMAEPTAGGAAAQDAPGDAAGTAAQAAPSDSAAAAAVVRAYHDALARGDSAAALELLAADAVIVEGGAIETVAHYRTHHLSADIAFARATRSRRGPVRVTLQEATAWAVSTTRIEGSYRGRPIASNGAELVVLSRTAQGWRIRAIHWSSDR